MSKFVRAAAVAAAFVASTAVATVSAQAQETIKVGVLHSLSGTMAISETTLKDTMLMLVDDLNAKGGLLGKKVEAAVIAATEAALAADLDQLGNAAPMVDWASMRHETQYTRLFRS